MPIGSFSGKRTGRAGSDHRRSPHFCVISGIRKSAQLGAPLFCFPSINGVYLVDLCVFAHTKLKKNKNQAIFWGWNLGKRIKKESVESGKTTFSLTPPFPTSINHNRLNVLVFFQTLNQKIPLYSKKSPTVPKHFVCKPPFLTLLASTPLLFFFRFSCLVLLISQFTPPFALHRAIFDEIRRERRNTEFLCWEELGVCW